jgi:hypothetical protein
MKRWLGLFGVFVAMVVVAVVVIRCPRPTVSGFKLVQPGMTRSEIRAILNEPGDYSGAGLLALDGRESDWIFLERGQRMRIAISLDEDGRVTDKALIPVFVRTLGE